jgi:hypothetical protein
MAVDEPRLQLHMEPQEPIEIFELTGALGAIARQYQSYALENELASKSSEARLLVSSVSPGSIDINFVPDFVYTISAAGPLLAPLIDKYELIEKFGKRLKSLLDLFSKKEVPENVSIRDCDDVISINKPIANHGGVQNFNIVQGDIKVTLLTVTAAEAIKLIETAAQHKHLLQNPDGEMR